MEALWPQAIRACRGNETVALATSSLPPKPVSGVCEVSRQDDGIAVPKVLKYPARGYRISLKHVVDEARKLFSSE